MSRRKDGKPRAGKTGPQEPREEHIARRQHGPLQRRKVREGGFGARKKKRFFAALAATCNVTWACRAAGISTTTPYVHRLNDPVFAEQWDAVIETGRAALKLMLNERAARGHEKAIELDDSTPFDDPSKMDTGLALQLINQREPCGRDRRSGVRRRRATQAETDASILRKLSVLNRRLGGKG
ncbi:MAG TPA: hypothetical protein VFZ91_04610 [Allosphingosinicella sp.]